MTATKLGDLDVVQIDVLLASHVDQRHAWQNTIATALSAVDHHTRRIDQLLAHRAKVTT